MNAHEAFLWSTRIISGGVFWQSIEMLQLRESYSDRGVWSWEILGQEFSPRLRRALGFFLAMPHFQVLLITRLLAALLACVFPHPAVLTWLFLTSFAVSFRWRGSFNGGSDSMTLLTLAALSVGAAGPSLLSAALVYLAIQCAFSYTIAGWTKLTQRSWRNGDALAEFLRLPAYEVPARILPMSRQRGPMRVFAWGVLLFECSFPLAFVNQSTAIAYLSAAVIFHLANAYVFGLNRFVWAWAATYPAILYCVL